MYMMNLNNVTIFTTDIQRLTIFYQKALHAQAIDEYGGPDRIEILMDGETHAHLILHQSADASTDNRKKIELEICVDDADAEYRRLTALGIAISEQPRTTPWGFRFFSFQDPEGNWITMGCSDNARE